MFLLGDVLAGKNLKEAAKTQQGRLQTLRGIKQLGSYKQ